MDYRSPEAEAASRERVQLLGDLFSREGAALAPHKEVPAANVADMQHVNEAVAFPNNLPTEFGLLLARAWKQQSRDKLPIAITLVQTTVIGFVLAAIYSGMDMSAIGIQDEVGARASSAFCRLVGCNRAVLTTSLPSPCPADRHLVLHLHLQQLFAPAQLAPGVSNGASCRQPGTGGEDVSQGLSPYACC